jgi:hypothetical protein
VRAFGLELDSDVPLAGLPAVPANRLGRPRATIVHLPRAELSRIWPQREATPPKRDPVVRHSSRISVEHDEAIGYRIHALELGDAVIADEGSVIWFAAAGTPWHAHRFLLGRVIPLTAVLRGIEAFHASAVGLEGRAVAFFGPSAGGKSSIAVNLALRGCSFVSDDVLAIEPCDGGVHVHPGAGVASIRHEEYDWIPPADRERLGRLLDRTDRAYVAVEREEQRLPLTTLYYLARGGDEIEFRRMSPPDPRLLLASTFIFEVRTAARMARQLEVCARLASSASAFELKIPFSTSAAGVAEAIERHARTHTPPNR